MNSSSIKSALTFLGASVLLATPLFAGGCHVRTSQRQPTIGVQLPSPQQQQQAPQQGGGVTVLESSCQPGAQELCNGLDDNCDGQIDEGCGYQSGDIQVTLAWGNGADMDLYVTDPQGAMISYQQRQSPSGGQLDQDARGSCGGTTGGGGGTSASVENIFWNNAQPPSGRYNIEVHYYAQYQNQCSRQNGPTTITLSIAVGGQVIGAYNYTLSPDERVQVASFDIP